MDSLTSMARDLSGTGSSSYAALLRDDDSLLRQIFFSVLRHHHPNLANKVSGLG